MLPEQYESALYLPFNRQSLTADFEFSAAASDDGQPGVWLFVQGNAVLLDKKSTAPADYCPPQFEGRPLWIGRWQGRPCRALALSRAVVCPDTLSRFDLQADDPQLSLALLSLAALARQMLHWHGNSRCCSACGATMDWLNGEWGKQCSGCQRVHYPHIHPCVIVLIQRGDELLLTRKALWAPGRYGLVAGFVEPGECLEETVRREVREETGVEIANLRYVGSQSWPFPSQIMMGFVADYAGGELKVDHHELEDARWFRRSALPDLPSRRSIARFLLDNY